MPITLFLDLAADTYADRIAVGTTADGISYADLRTAAYGGASLVTKASASHVAFLGVSGPAFPVALFASSVAGVPFTPLNYRLSADQLAEQLEELGRPFVVADPEYADAASRGAGELLTTSDWLTAAGEAPAATPADGDDGAAAVVLFTSGTTSKPKGVLLRHENLTSYVLQTVEFASADESDASLISVPPYHIAGVGTVLTNIYSGRRMVYLPNFTADGWLDIVRGEGITNAMVVPTMLARVVDTLAGTPAETPTLRSIAYGGARMPRPVLESALTAFPATDFVNAYGLTETSSTIAVLGPDDHRAALSSDDPAVQARLASAGRMVPGVEAQVRDEDGNPLGPGEFGELFVRGGQVSGEYVGHGSVLDAEGWFPTRDRASLDVEGYLFIEGRSDDTIIRGGENIAPAEIEDVLVLHPDVHECAVIGLPDDEWGERIVAVVVRHVDTLDVDTVKVYVRERLRGSRTPDDVVFVTELPYTPTGKLLRRQLVTELTEK